MSQTLPANNEHIETLLQQAYASRTSELDKSIELASEALTLSKKAANTCHTAKSLSHLSLFHMIKGQYDTSKKMAEEAIAHYKTLNDEKGIADAKYNIAGIYYKTDNLHLGLVYLIDCLATYHKFNDNHNIARVQKSLGTIYEFFGDENNAIRVYEASIEAAKKAGDVSIESNAYNPLSGIYLKRGQVENALKTIEKAIQMKESTGDTRGLAFALYGRAKVFTREGKYEQAEKDLKRALEIHEHVGEKLGTAMAYRKLGVLYMKSGKTEQAIATLNHTQQFCADNNIVLIMFKSSYHLYDIYREKGELKQALTYLEKYLKEKESVINTQTLQVIENYELIKKMEMIEKEVQSQKEKAEIIEKKNLAEKASKMKQDFLSTMSHEIRTPLNAVITISSLLKDRANEEDQELLGSLRFAANNLLNLVNDILDFTKLDTGKEKLELRPVNLKTLLENVRKTYDALAKGKGLKLFLNIDSDISESYEIDETKLSQILGNLISNAIKYTEVGRIDIEVEKIMEANDMHQLKFKVADTGLGIAKEHHKLIFESFSQPHTVTTRKHGGSGLGLAIVKKLVVLHGGHVRVESTPGAGSDFIFELKMKPAIPKEKTPAKQFKDLENKVVLLAEDNMLNAMVAIKLLSKWGIKTTHAKNGVEAIEQAKIAPYDFILMDIHMPEMNGFEATKNIRQEPNPNMRTPIFALTADVTAEQQEEYVSYFNGFLTKPIEINKMYEALASA
jgi:signal transduction histidine kinase/CheY-like chemotaxis protein